jgi:Predicted ATPase (AAA+ superfamily)
MRKENYIPRVIDIEERLKKNSQFLFGPRQTGKSSFIRCQMTETPRMTWNLLDSRIRRKAEKDPAVLREELKAENITEGVVVIDEIQKVPELLDEVHNLIEETDIHFLLTGSSARKLKAGSANLLGGRAWMNYIHVLVYPEVAKSDYSLEHIFETGLLPTAYTDRENSDSILSGYVDLYVAEEIQKEAEIRRLQPFLRFLEQAALYNTEQLNYSNIASDAGVSSVTVKGWYQILIDTLMGFELLAYCNTRKRKAIGVSKFYFLMSGWSKHLQGKELHWKMRQPLESTLNSTWRRN